MNSVTNISHSDEFIEASNLFNRMVNEAKITSPSARDISETHRANVYTNDGISYLFLIEHRIDVADVVEMRPNQFRDELMLHLEYISHHR
jgi:hypothetical protein